MADVKKCRTCKHAFTTGKDRWYCKKSLADKDDCGEYMIKKDTKRIDWNEVIAFIYIFLLVLTPFIVLGYIALRIYVFFVYGNTPITEIPSWVFWIAR